MALVEYKARNVPKRRRFLRTRVLAPRPRRKRGRGQPRRGRKQFTRLRRAGNNISPMWGRIGGAIGSQAFGLPGGLIGTLAGGAIGRMYKTITGHGDYKILSNSLTRPMPVPSFGENCIRIRHKEYLGDLNSAALFTSYSYPINPGLASTFPWLAPIASQFEQWIPLGMVFEFVSTSSNALNSTNTALGKVVMATEYNALNPGFTTVEQMLATEFSNYGKPAENLMHAIECAPGRVPNNLYYVRTGPPVGDTRLYDLGNFQIAMDGMQAVSNVGGLWCSYDILLCKPIINPSLDANQVDQFTWPLLTGTGSTLYSNTYSTTITNVHDQLGGTFTASSTNYVYTFNPNVVPHTRYICFLTIRNSATSSVTNPSSLSNVTVTYSNLLNGSAILTPGIGGGTNNLTQISGGANVMMQVQNEVVPQETTSAIGITYSGGSFVVGSSDTGWQGSFTIIYLPTV